MGDVIGDLNCRRGTHPGHDPARQDTQVITAEVPLATMFGYATDLRSKTQGPRYLHDAVSRYEPVPSSVQDEVVQKRGS